MIRRLIDMQASSELVGYSAIQAYGTSEGVRKAWETRPRKNEAKAYAAEHASDAKSHDRAASYHLDQAIKYGKMQWDINRGSDKADAAAKAHDAAVNAHQDAEDYTHYGDATKGGLNKLSTVARAASRVANRFDRVG